MPQNNNYIVSWSGGKDCCLALYRATKQFGKPAYLLNILTEDGYRSRSHGLTKDILELQAKALNIPIRFYSTSWDNYEATFLDALKQFHHEGISFSVFGDIKLINDPDWNTHKKWADDICHHAQMHAEQPLWDESSESLVNEFITAGFKAKIIAVNQNKLDSDFLGQTLDGDIISRFKTLGIDPAGERGEYHTIVTDGPTFSFSLQVEDGECVLKSGYWFLDVKKSAPPGHGTE